MTESTTFNLSHELVKSWAPCADGYRWFLSQFPQGGAYTVVHAALRADNRFSDADWLFGAALAYAIQSTPATTADIVAVGSDEVAKLIESTKPISIGATPVIGSTNDDGTDHARINATGENAVVACAGLSARAKAGANGALALAFWDDQAERVRFAVGYVGEGIKADTWYVVTEQGEFQEVAE